MMLQPAVYVIYYVTAESNYGLLQVAPY